jgi:signal peptidase II
MDSLAYGLLILLVDQWSKKTIREHAANRVIALGPLLQLRPMAHRRSLYQKRGSRTALLLMWTSALVSAALLRRTGPWFQSSAALIGLGLAFGGSASNLLDILRRRHVIDFIDLGWWPVFNLADVAILAGLIAALDL